MYFAPEVPCRRTLIKKDRYMGYTYSFMEKRILVTGFEPFLNFSENPTAKIATYLNEKTSDNLKFSGRILPVDYENVEQKLVGFIDETKPNLIIGTGLAAGRAKISIEKIAINYKYSQEKDNKGNRSKGERIDSSIEDGIFSLLSVEKLVQLLNKKMIPAEVSLTAGAYLCNYAMFVIVRESKRRKIKGGFIHVPADLKLSSSNAEKSYPSLNIETMMDALKIVSNFELNGKSR